MKKQKWDPIANKKSVSTNLQVFVKNFRILKFHFVELVVAVVAAVVVVQAEVVVKVAVVEKDWLKLQDQEEHPASDEEVMWRKTADLNRYRIENEPDPTCSSQI